MHLHIGAIILCLPELCASLEGKQSECYFAFNVVGR